MPVTRQCCLNRPDRRLGGRRMSGQTAANYIALAGLVVNLVVLAFPAVQLVLLRKQVDRAEDSLISEQRRSNKQSTFEYLIATIERRHEFLARIPSEKHAVAAFIAGLKDKADDRRELVRFLNYYETLAAGVNSG